MTRGSIYAGWTHAGPHRVWVRVPAELKRQAERANGDGAHPPGSLYSHLRASTITEQAEAFTDPYWRRHPLNGDEEGGARTPVVILHGIATSSHRMEPLLRGLGSNRASFAPDLPGFGRSDPPGQALDVESLANSLRRWMIDNRVAPATLLGISFGAQVAIEVASRHAVVERLILVALTDPAERKRRGYPLRWALNSPLLVPAALRRMLGACGWQARRALKAARSDPVEEKLELIEAPTLVIRGARDRVSTESWARRVADAVPNARIETLEGAGHMPSGGSISRLVSIVDSFLAEEDEARAGSSTA